MRCEQAREQLALRVSGELEHQQRALLDAHLAVCATCSAELLRWAACRAALAPVRPELPDGFWDGYAGELAVRLVLAPERPELPADFWDGYTEEVVCHAVLAPERPELPAGFWEGFTEEVLARAVRVPAIAAQPPGRRWIRVALAASLVAVAALLLQVVRQDRPAAPLVAGRAGLLPAPPIEAPAVAPVAPRPTLGFQLANHPVGGSQRLVRQAAVLGVASRPATAARAAFQLGEARAPAGDARRSFDF